MPVTSRAGIKSPIHVSEDGDTIEDGEDEIQIDDDDDDDESGSVGVIPNESRSKKGPRSF